jgi:hypothetical protein
MIAQRNVRGVLLACSVLMIAASVAVCQQPRPVPAVPFVLPPAAANIDANPTAAPFAFDEPGPTGPGAFDFGRPNSGFLNGNHDFDRFIGFISNPIQSIDPRAVTTFFPIFGSAWASGNSPVLPEANAQVYGAGLSAALSDRLSLGFTQGGYAVMNITGDREGLLRRLGLPISDRNRGGQREGWLNLGGYLQYTLIADAQDQFILTSGIRWEAPSGAEQVFQGGAEPAYLAPYFTVGKECNCWHVLATTGFEFPTGQGTSTTETFYLNWHIDRQIGWLYPLVEFNGSYHTTTVDLTLPVRHGVIDLGTFDSSGNLLDIAVGANAVLVPNKLELGAVYVRPIAAQYHFDFNGLLVKMVYRF